MADLHLEMSCMDSVPGHIWTTIYIGVRQFWPCVTEKVISVRIVSELGKRVVGGLSVLKFLF